MPTPLTVSQVHALAPDSWVSGFMAVVRSTVPAEGKKPMKAVLAEPTGSATIDASLWARPNLEIGSIYEFGGKGIKVTSYNGKNQVSVGDKATISKMGASVHAPEQTQRLAASEPALDGTLHPVEGQAVGHALTNAIKILTEGRAPHEIHEQIITPVFWESVHEVASDIIRVSRLLSTGRLAKPIKERCEEIPY